MRALAIWLLAKILENLGRRLTEMSVQEIERHVVDIESLIGRIAADGQGPPG
jgi:hypothetical protein